jgi:hypothetical protein
MRKREVIEPRHPLSPVGDAVIYAEANRRLTYTCVGSPRRGLRAWHARRGLAVNMGSPVSWARRALGPLQGVKSENGLMGNRMTEAP